MKLETIRVTNFRCIEDSGTFKVDQVACLVGKNESGKTSLLQALAKLNPVEQASKKLDKDRDYPRRLLADFDSETNVLETVWNLSQNDMLAVEAVLGQGCLESTRLTVTKDYNPEGATYLGLSINEERVVESLISDAGCDSRDRASLSGVTTIEGLMAKAEPLKSSSPRITTITERVAKWRGSSPTNVGIDVLWSRMPKFLYFSNYDRMDGNVSLEALRAAVTANTPKKNDLVFLALLDFAGTSLEELAKLDKHEPLTARVESASIKISNRIFKYWSQNRHLKVRFSVDVGRPGDLPPFNSGNVMRTRIYNSLHEMTVPFDDRSAGFVWFFSFLVLFSQVKKKHGNVIILLDEPGLNLHAKAQSDLLRFINEELKPHHQVLYTTHSPFMIPANDLASVRTVEDVVEYEPDGEVRRVLGTKVGDDVLSTDRDTLFPLQGALGYEITQSLFVGKHTLIVEGPSDILYLQSASAELARRRRANLDSRWTICPSGGVDKVSAFISLFGGQGLHVATLLDYAHGQKSKVENLRKSNLLQSGHVFVTTEFCAQPEADVEDFFGQQLYVELVNAGCNLTGANSITVKDVQNSPEQSLRVVKRVEAVIQLRPSVSEFNHFLPATWLLQNPAWFSQNSPEIDAALNRFEECFKKLNALL